MVTLLQEINTPLSRSQLDELLDMLDKDGDGEIDLKWVTQLLVQVTQVIVQVTQVLVQVTQVVVQVTQQ